MIHISCYLIITSNLIISNLQRNINGFVIINNYITLLFKKASRCLGSSTIAPEQTNKGCLYDYHMQYDCVDGRIVVGWSQGYHNRLWKIRETSQIVSLSSAQHPHPSPPTHKPALPPPIPPSNTANRQHQHHPHRYQQQERKPHRATSTTRSLCMTMSVLTMFT